MKRKWNENGNLRVEKFCDIQILKEQKVILSKIISSNYVSRPYPRERPAKTLVFAGWSDRDDRTRNLKFRRVLFSLV